MLTRILSALVLIPVVVGIVWFAPPMGTTILLAVVLVISLRELVDLTPKQWPLRVVLAVFWIGMPLAILAWIRTNWDPQVILFLFVLIVVSDSAQYFAGRMPEEDD